MIFCYLSGKINSRIDSDSHFFFKRDFIQVRHRGLNSFAFSPLITILQFEEMKRTNGSTYPIAQYDACAL